MLAIAYVLIGNGLYDEAIRHFSTMLQVSFLFGPLKYHFMKLSITTYGFSKTKIQLRILKWEYFMRVIILLFVHLFPSKHKHTQYLDYLLSIFLICRNKLFMALWQKKRHLQKPDLCKIGVSLIALLMCRLKYFNVDFLGNS